MTDSMKFGPEWLRNMSGDMNNVISSNNSNSSGGGGSGNGSSANLITANCNSSNTQAAITNQAIIGGGSSRSNHYQIHSGSVGGGSAPAAATCLTATSSYAPTARNMFPEFRYGREEMLSLFDKNCTVPEILSSYKKIYVEKVQYPLALTPSTDEDMLSQGPNSSTQRSAWIQRSPIGFSGSSTRVGGGCARTGSVDRGRGIRSKSMYHPIYQRPSTMFEEDLRSTTLKTERSWSERNGVGDTSGSNNATGGNNVIGVGGTTGGVMNISPEWNGTPISSPRKEFLPHARNIENWRRSRNEESASDAATCVGNDGLNSSTDGWRGSSSSCGGGGGIGGGINCFGSNYRWGRSTSWRDEDLSNVDGGNGASSATTTLMQRSYSTISTTMSERNSGGGGAIIVGGYMGSNSGSSKGSSQNTNPSGNYSHHYHHHNQNSGTNHRLLNSLNNSGSVGGSSMARTNHWAFNNGASVGDGGIGSSGSNTINGGNTDDDANLPEWAMENPSNCGGTFDASGAFHGSVENEDDRSSSGGDVKDTGIQICKRNVNANRRPQQKQEPASADNLITNNTISASKLTIKNKNKPTNPNTKSVGIDYDNLVDKTEATSDNVMGGHGAKNRAAKRHNINNETVKEETVSDVSSSTSSAADASNRSATNLYSNEPHSNRTNTTTVTIVLNEQPSASVSSNDYPDRMKEVADDMVQKLIMDDDCDGDSNSKSSLMTTSANQNNSQVPDTIALSGDTVAPAISVLLQKASVTALQHQQHHYDTAPASQNSFVSSTAISPKGTTTPLPLYGGGGIVVDHSTVEQNQQHNHHHDFHNHQNLQQQLATVATASVAAVSTGIPPTSSTSDLWYYRDPQSKIQGPFTALEMTEWYRAGYFNENLYVRRSCDTHFRALGELTKLCHGNMPFTHAHLIPIGSMMERGVGMPSTSPSNAATISGADQPPVGLKSNKPQHNEHRDDLKGSVTAAADTLSTAVKNLISPMDMSHILNMNFQMLQEQYVCHQEMLIVTELSKNECFQRLKPSERKAVVRQKLQMLSLPEYLTSLTGLSNTLSSVNPSAGNQLHDAIAACSKKEHIRHQQQQHSTNTSASTINPFSEAADDFILNALHQQQQEHHEQQHLQATTQVPFPSGNAVGFSYDSDAVGAVGQLSTTRGSDLTGNELLSEFNLRMFLQGGGGVATSVGSNVVQSSTIVVSAPSPPQLSQQNRSQDYMIDSATNNVSNNKNIILTSSSSSNEYLTDQQLITAAAHAHNPMMQMWMTQQQGLMLPQQLQQHPQQHEAPLLPPTAQQNQWTAGGPLVGMPSAVALVAASVAASGTGQPNSIPTSMWCNVASGVITPLSDQKQLEQQQNVINYEDQHQQKQQKRSQQHQQNLITSNQSHHMVAAATNDQQQQPFNEVRHSQEQHHVENRTVNEAGGQQHMANVTENSAVKQHQEKHQKQRGSSNKQQQQYLSKAKDDSSNNNNRKINEEERNRREQIDEKRRLKDEKKRQQLEEEKRRTQQAEEEKRRQMQEEKERQQQIQAQRRKAMLGNNATTVTSSITTVTGKTNRQQSSIAPWSSIQTAAVAGGKNSPPCLAEIQKAERRERRADQQRQMELLEKQMRANAAVVAEANDTILKWNASPVPPVKSFAEIQAEETKLLAAEQLEQQRRREQEQQQLATATVEATGIGLVGGGSGVTGNINYGPGSSLSGGNGSSSNSNISAIWGGLGTSNFSSGGGGNAGNKAWANLGSSTAIPTTGFWNEPLPVKFSSAIGGGGSSSNMMLHTTAAEIVAGGGNSSAKQQFGMQQQHKFTNANSGGIGAASSTAATTTIRNLRKSQTVSVMQNTATMAAIAAAAARNYKNSTLLQQNNGSSSNNQTAIKSSSTGNNNKMSQQKSIEMDKNAAPSSGKQQVTGGTGSSSSSSSSSSNHNNKIGGASSADDFENEFTGWCTKTLNSMNTKVDVPTFVTFLQDLESPYEVKDYIRMYLGEAKEYMEFAKQFLERRSKYKNLQRAQNAHNDDMCKPAPAITPYTGNDNYDNKAKPKKVKKNKMTKLDARILGFSVTAAEGRINVGDRDYVDGP